MDIHKDRVRSWIVDADETTVCEKVNSSQARAITMITLACTLPFDSISTTFRELIDKELRTLMLLEMVNLLFETVCEAILNAKGEKWLFSPHHHHRVLQLMREQGTMNKRQLTRTGASIDQTQIFP